MAFVQSYRKLGTFRYVSFGGQGRASHWDSDYWTRPHSKIARAVGAGLGGLVVRMVTDYKCC